MTCVLARIKRKAAKVLRGDPEEGTGQRPPTVAEAGRAGGESTLARKGRAFYAEIGAKGGRAGGSRGGKRGGARVRALVAAGKRAKP